MLDLETFLHNAMAARRAEEMKTSEQLTLGELLLKLEAIEDKDKPVIFNEVYHPTGASSWRGSYDELALEYDTRGDLFSVRDFSALLTSFVGGTVYGYKGGEFLVGKTTPVWVANYGESHGFQCDGETQAVVDVTQDEQHVIIQTKCLEY